MVARPEPGSPLAVTVLGSGGPRPTARRASAGYLLWVDGEPRVLVDPSGGVLERLAGADVEPAVLELVVLTHTHIDHSARSVAFSGDLEGAHAGLQALALRCDVLVHDQALPRRDIEHGHLHPPPEDTAANAAGAEVGTLVLSHLMPPAEAALDDVVARVRAGYGGPVVVAEDLLTASVGGDGTVTTS